jgi:type IV pilus assembly protein PilO
MTLEELNNLDPNDFGNWPIPVKAVIIVLLCAALLGAGYYFDTQHQIIALDTAEREEVELLTKFEDKQKRAATLPALKAQLIVIKRILDDMQKRLPNKAEVDSLITEVSQATIASGLKKDLFQLEQEAKGDIYYTQPIKLILRGNYDSFGKFSNTLAAMQRIVNQSVNTISSKGMADLTNDLTVDSTVYIYRYIGEGDGEEGKGAGK